MKHLIRCSVLVVCFIVSAADAAPSSRLSYAKQCGDEMGEILEFNCMTGASIPITKDGQPMDTRTEGEDCDNPIQLEIGSSQCVPHSRYLRINTDNPDVETAVICRKYEEDDHGPDNSQFSDIAIVQHNKATGNTCFFQSKVGEHLDGTAVPSPQEDSDNASKYWYEPTSGGPDGIRCTACHDADPFIWSKYIIQVANPDHWDALGKWNSNYQDLFGVTVQTFRPDNNDCVDCHRIGSEVCENDDPGHGRVSVLEVKTEQWMPPGFSGSVEEWESQNEDALQKLFDCCEDPSQPSCNTVDQTALPVVTITAPSHGAPITAANAVTFTGSATDAEDGNLSASLAWTSDIDGVLGTGGMVTRSDLSVGPHIITARVIDSGGQRESAQLPITVTEDPGSLTFEVLQLILMPLREAGGGEGDDPEMPEEISEEILQLLLMPSR